MSAITLRIVTPKEIAFEGQTDMVTGPSFDGEFGILENHTRFLTLSEPGIIYLGETKGDGAFAVGKGFAEIADNVVTFLVDFCVAEGDVEGTLEEHLQAKLAQ